MSRPIEPSTPSIARPHLLIVTADAGLKDFLGEGLIVAGFWTSTVASALQVLEVFRLRTFDLVLVDATLGGVGSIELVRRLRGRSSRAAGEGARTDVPILFVAADPSEVEVETAATAGADAVIVAPIELEELAPRLHGIVQTWRAAHPGRPYADEVAQLRPGEG